MLVRSHVNAPCAGRRIAHCSRLTIYSHAFDHGVDVIAFYEPAAKDICVHLSIKKLRDVKTAQAPVMHEEQVSVLTFNLAKNSRADSAAFDQVGSFGGNDEQGIIPRDDKELLNWRL